MPPTPCTELSRVEGTPWIPTQGEGRWHSQGQRVKSESKETKVQIWAQPLRDSRAWISHSVPRASSFPLWRNGVVLRTPWGELWESFLQTTVALHSTTFCQNIPETGPAPTPLKTYPSREDWLAQHVERMTLDLRGMYSNPMPHVEPTLEKKTKTSPARLTSTWKDEQHRKSPRWCQLRPQADRAARPVEKANIEKTGMSSVDRDVENWISHISH